MFVCVCVCVCVYIYIYIYIYIKCYFTLKIAIIMALLNGTNGKAITLKFNCDNTNIIK